MTTTATQEHIRREADRKAYLDETRAANAMRADAARWRSISDDLTADMTVYGPRAAEYLAGVKARLEIVAGWCDVEAERRQEYAEQYRALIVGAHQ